MADHAVPFQKTKKDEDPSVDLSAIREREYRLAKKNTQHTCQLRIYCSGYHC